MTKDEIQSGMLVQFRNGDMYMVVESQGMLLLVSDKYISYLWEYKKHLKHRSERSLDIVKVFSHPISNEYMLIRENWNSTPVVWDRSTGYSRI